MSRRNRLSTAEDVWAHFNYTSLSRVERLHIVATDVRGRQLTPVIQLARGKVHQVNYSSELLCGVVGAMTWLQPWYRRKIDVLIVHNHPATSSKFASVGDIESSVSDTDFLRAFRKVRRVREFIIHKSEVVEYSGEPYIREADARSHTAKFISDLLEPNRKRPKRK